LGVMTMAKDGMDIELGKGEVFQLTTSIQKYFREELEQDIGELQAKLLLDYVLKEIGPFAYNKGVRDAEEYMRLRVEDMSGTCFQPALTYWKQKRK
jgi:uncharacterized protein (DUF2164 family)